MSVNATYPGVYVQQIPSTNPIIPGASTSVTAFIGLARRGPVDEPTPVQSYDEFTRIFGGLWASSGMSYSVMHYFDNGGAEALIVRVVPADATAGRTDLDAGSGTKLTLVAADEGAWYGNVYVSVDYAGVPAATDFNLTIREYPTDPGTDPSAAAVSEETFTSVSMDPSAASYIGKVLSQSSLVRLDPSSTATARPLAVTNQAPVAGTASDGTLTDVEIAGNDCFTNRRGMYALDAVPIFNLLVLPPLTRDASGAWIDVNDSLAPGGQGIWNALIVYAAARRAFAIVDPASSWDSVAAAMSGVAALALSNDNGAIYFPQIEVPDPLRGNAVESFAPSGAIAGIFARTDVTRNVWSAPAGLDAGFDGVTGLSVQLDDSETGQLATLGINTLRTIPTVGSVIWGARTLCSADPTASGWKHIPPCRTSFYIRESLYWGLQWTAFEPNDQGLWTRIRSSVEVFLNQLFLQGAFNGAAQSEAYFVICDATTTTAADVAAGVVNVTVGVALELPGEFAIITIQQMAGQGAS